jgi:hypothetical protein
MPALNARQKKYSTELTQTSVSAVIVLGHQFARRSLRAADTVPT